MGRGRLCVRRGDRGRRRARRLAPRRTAPRSDEKPPSVARAARGVFPGARSLGRRRPRRRERAHLAEWSEWLRFAGDHARVRRRRARVRARPARRRAGRDATRRDGESEKTDERRVAAAGGRAVRVCHGCRVARAVANARRRRRERRLYERFYVRREGVFARVFAGRGAVAFRARRVGARRRADSAAARERLGGDARYRDP